MRSYWAGYIVGVIAAFSLAYSFHTSLEFGGCMTLGLLLPVFTGAVTRYAWAENS